MLLTYVDNDNRLCELFIDTMMVHPHSVDETEFRFKPATKL